MDVKEGAELQQPEEGLQGGGLVDVAQGELVLAEIRR